MGPTTLGRRALLVVTIGAIGACGELPKEGGTLPSITGMSHGDTSTTGECHFIVEPSSDIDVGIVNVGTADIPPVILRDSCNELLHVVIVEHLSGGAAFPDGTNSGQADRVLRPDKEMVLRPNVDVTEDGPWAVQCSVQAETIDEDDAARREADPEEAATPVTTPSRPMKEIVFRGRGQLSSE